MGEHFIVAGAQRCATTYIYHLLAEHPEIEMAVPLKPEPKFFLLDDLFERGLDCYEEHFFKGKANARLRGEKSTSYIESEKAARRIAEALPGAKLVFILRDPIDRAVSNYWFSVQNDVESLPMEQAFRQEEARREDYDHDRISVSPYAYLKRGRYIDYLLMYERHVPREQMIVLLYEQLVGSDAALRALYRALGVDETFSPPSLGEIVNPGEKPDTDMSAGLRAYLEEYFAAPNARLAEWLDFDPREWWQP